jgi:hypothetical protein
MVSRIDISKWPAAERGACFNSKLASAKSAKVGGRFYAEGCLHTTIPEDCLVVDTDTDIVVDIAANDSFVARKSHVKARYLVTSTGEAAFVGASGEPLLMHELRTIALFNTMLRKKQPQGSARDNKGDMGAMHPIGLRVDLDGVHSSVYACTFKAPSKLAKAYVTALSRVGQVLFPDVLAVMQDTEADTGMKPCAAMGGDNDGNRVGMSIDTSDGLINSSHYDGNDASQGIGAWTEEVPGLAHNWYFVMPNMHGIRADGRPFNGIAIKLQHGTAISWDGRLIRHCTSMMNPDGPEGHSNPVGRNHVYGTFSAAKERVVNAGRKRMALLTEMEEFYREDEDRIKFHKEEPHGEWPPYNPTWRDADPDDRGPPKDEGSFVHPLVRASLAVQSTRIPRVWVPAPSREHAVEVLSASETTAAASPATEYTIPRKKRKVGVTDT